MSSEVWTSCSPMSSSKSLRHVRDHHEGGGNVACLVWEVIDSHPGLVFDVGQGGMWRRFDLDCVHVMVGGNALLYKGMVSYHEAQGETKQSPIWERRGTWL